MLYRQLACILLLALVAGGADAGKVYRWVDAQGKVHYGDRPDGAKAAVEVRPGVTTTVPDATPGSDAGAEAKRAALCTQKREQLGTYKNASRIVEKDSLGNEKEFTAEEQLKLIEKTERDIEALCADNAAS